MKHYFILLLTAVSCFCLPSCLKIHSTLGHKLDSWGKSVPHARIPSISTPLVYLLDGCYYMPLEVHFYPEEKAAVRHTFTNIKGTSTYSEWPKSSGKPRSEKSVLYLFPLNDEEAKRMILGQTKSCADGKSPIPHSEFPYQQAHCYYAAEQFIPASAAPRRSLTYTLDTTHSIAGIPPERSVGNYARIPLSALTAWCIDLPLSITATAAGTSAGIAAGTVLMPFGILTNLFLTDSGNTDDDDIRPHGDPPPRIPIPPKGSRTTPL